MIRTRPVIIPVDPKTGEPDQIPVDKKIHKIFKLKKQKNIYIYYIHVHPYEIQPIYTQICKNSHLYSKSG